MAFKIPSTGKATNETNNGTATLLFPFKNQELPTTVHETGQKMTFFGTLEPYQGPWGRAQAAHLLRRTGFGVKKSNLDLILSLDLNAAVDKILTPPASVPAPPVNNYNNPDLTDPDVPEGETWINAPYSDSAEGHRIESWRGWWYDLMLVEEASILERMTLFWHNHFATQTEIVFWGKAIYKYNSKLRAHALGNFKELTKVITTDVMMLYYLNGYLNKKDAPDENYARELQELFTVGKDGGQQFTEDDVIAAARVLTGWRINFETAESYHFPIEHDFENKQFSAFYDNTVVQGAVQGEVELDALLDMIFARPEVSEHICRKLYRWLVYYQIDDNTEQNIIKPLAQVFRDNNYEIVPVLETLLKSEHFFEATQSGCFIKTPVDIVIGTMRSFGHTLPGTTPYDHFVFQYILSYFMGSMKMIPGDPPNVAGWQPFRQSPQYYRYWINGDSLRNRNTYTDVMSTYFIETENDQFKFDHIAFAGQFSDPSDPNILIDEATALLLAQELSPQKKFLLKSILLSGLPTDNYWTAAWNDFQNNPDDPMAFEVVWTRLTAMHYYIMRLPEFQLA